jgi:hypothetical protein
VTTSAFARRGDQPGAPFPRPTLQRDWYPTRAAAGMTGLSERTLRRYIQQPHWREGFHYRWITRTSRRTLEIHVARAVRLMEQWGWG